MRFLPKKKYIITSLLAGFMFVAVSFKNDFFEIAKQIAVGLHDLSNSQNLDE